MTSCGPKLATMPAYLCENRKAMESTYLVLPSLKRQFVAEATETIQGIAESGNAVLAECKLHNSHCDVVGSSVNPAWSLLCAF